jgi:hypothetical protein
MYSWLGVGVKRAAAAAVLLHGLAIHAQSGQVVCDPTLAVLWTPRHPQLGRYEVCTTPRPLADLADPSWTIELVAPLDAFGAAGSFNRAAVAQLYGGRRPAVARGWTTANGRFVSITLVSPYPDRELTALEPGTLIIRYFVTG